MKLRGNFFLNSNFNTKRSALKILELFVHTPCVRVNCRRTVLGNATAVIIVLHINV